MNSKGFTLIETVVILGVMGLLLVVTGGVMSNAMKLKSQSALLSNINRTGSTVLDEIRDNVMSAVGDSMVCGATGVEFTNVQDGQRTDIYCDATTAVNKIASASATTIMLVDGVGVTVKGCDNFVSCVPSLTINNRIDQVNFQFSLNMGGNEEGAYEIGRTFSASYTIRN